MKGWYMSSGARRILVLYSRDRANGGPPPKGASYLTVLENSPRGHTITYHDVALRVPGAEVRSRAYDAVVLHGSALGLRAASTSALDWVGEVDALRIALPTDEHDRPGLLDAWLCDLGVHVVFTQVDEPLLAEVYPRLHGRADFEPWHGLHADAWWHGAPHGDPVPLADRAPSLLVRGFQAPYWLGDAGQLETRLVAEVERWCAAATDAPRLIVAGVQALPDAISSRNLHACRAFVGAESGASTLDPEGEARTLVLQQMAREPHLTYAEAATLLPGQGQGPLLAHPGPHLVDAIRARTGLILVEGRYGGLLEPGRHYLPVRRDLSDLPDRLEDLRDVRALQERVDRAHADVIESGRVSLRALAERLDAVMDRARRPAPAANPGSPAGSPPAANPGSPAGSAPAANPGSPAGSAGSPAPPPVGAHEALAQRLAEHADSVVILSETPWRGVAALGWPGLPEIASHLPVFAFVLDPDVDAPREECDPSGILVVRHPASRPVGPGHHFNRVLCQAHAIRPIVVADGPAFHDFVVTRFSALTVLVVTHPLAHELEAGLPPEVRERLDPILARTDLVLCAGEHARRSFVEHAGFGGAIEVIPPFPSLGLAGRTPRSRCLATPPRPAVLVPDPLDPGLDALLLMQVARAMPDLAFRVGCAPPVQDLEGSPLLGLPNIEFLGPLSAEDWKWAATRCTAAFLPCRQGRDPVEACAYLISLLACGVPVVSAAPPPDPSLTDALKVASTVADIQVALSVAAAPSGAGTQGPDAGTQAPDAGTQAPDAGTQPQDAGTRPQEVASRPTSVHPAWLALASHLERLRTSVPPSGPPPRLNVLYLYDDNWVHIETLREYLESFGQFSRHATTYASGILTSTPSVDLAAFDVVMIHYSVRISLPSYISQAYADALEQFGGLKVLFIQDEYETTEQARRWIHALGIHQVYTCVPDAYREIVYPSARLPHVRFRQILTGYVSPRYEQAHAFRPMSERTIHIGYRGRALPYWYGRLGQEKMIIGREMRRICEAKGIPVDIEWDDSHRIYGKAWLDFHESCRAVLGSESGANVFDYHGDLRRDITTALEANPDLTFEEAYGRFLDGRDGEVDMAQISPRVFEAISLGAALILFEGGYSGVLEPGVHYLSLRKDFSNADEILEHLADDEFLTAMTRRAYEDIVASGRYSYRRFVATLDDDLEREVRHGSGFRLVSVVAGERHPEGRSRVTHEGWDRGHPASIPLSRELDIYAGAKRETDDTPSSTPPPAQEEAAEKRPVQEGKRPGGADAASPSLEASIGRIQAQVDSVVILCGATWRQAERTWLPLAVLLAKRLPVHVFKADLECDGFEREPIGVPGLTAWRVRDLHGETQRLQVHEILAQQRVRRPLVICASPDFHVLAATRFSALTVLLADRPPSPDVQGDPATRSMVAQADLVLCREPGDDTTLASERRALAAIADALPRKPDAQAVPLNVLVAHDEPDAYTRVGLDFLREHPARSRHLVARALVTREARVSLDLCAFDVMLVVAPGRTSLWTTMSQDFAHAIRRHGAYKVLLLEGTGAPAPPQEWIDRLGFHAVFLMAGTRWLRIPGRLEVVTFSDPAELSPVLEAHLARRVSRPSGLRLVHETVGYCDPRTERIHLSTASHVRGCPCSDLLDALPVSPATAADALSPGGIS